MMIAALYKLARLTPADCWGLSVAYLYLLRAGWRLFVRKERLDHWVASKSAPGPSAPLTREESLLADLGSRRVNVAARYPLPWARCLQRSLALCLWLERRGVQPELKIGVRREGPTLQGHAWVECGGRVLNDRPDISREFAPLSSAPVDWTRTRWQGEMR